MPVLHTSARPGSATPASASRGASSAKAPRQPPLAPPPGPLDVGPNYRSWLLATAPTQRYDILVIGGGINGAAIAYDAAMRGFSVLVVEKEDFASGTSSRSSKLIHGGIRYLKQFELGLIFESLRERALLLKLCPHLVRPLPFLYPVFDGASEGKLAVLVGMNLYDALALFRTPARHRILSESEVAEREPALGRKGLRTTARYFDAWMNDARLVLATMLGAIRCGADVLPHTEVRGLLHDGERVHGALLTDRIGGTDLAVEARLVVNAAGPWLDQIAALERPGNGRRLRPTKGVHILVSRERLSLNNAVVLRAPDDGRTLFAIPWERMTLIGTTDTYHDGPPDTVYADRDDVGYLLRAVNAAFPGAQLERKDVRSTYAGLRPLISEEGKTESDVSREHEIFLSPGGMLSIGGGKFTTFRHIAEQVVDHAAEVLAERWGLVRRGTRTDRFPFEGGDLGDAEAFEAELARRLDGRGDPGLAAHLARNYGTNARAVLDLVERGASGDGRHGAARLLEPLVPGLPYSMAEMLYAARYEMPGRLADLFMRRTQLQLEAHRGGLDVAEPVARAVAPTLGWSTERIGLELARYEAEVGRTLACVS